MKLTAEEQAAADLLAKENAQKEKDTKDKKSEGGGTEEGDDEESEEADSDDVKVLKAQNEKLKKENAKRRVSERDTKAQIERQNKALAILQGKDVGTVDPIEKAQTESKLKMSRALIKAELSTVARDAHNPGKLFAAFSDKFKDIEVDLDAETVDTDALKEAVDSIREENPWMFQSKESESSKPAIDPKTGKRAPDKGTPAAGKSHKAEWNRLKQAGLTAEAAKYYKENRLLILTQL